MNNKDLISLGMLRVAEQLHIAGLHCFHDYISMGQSREAWDEFRKKIASNLVQECDVYLKNEDED